MAQRHYSRELDPFAATLVETNSITGFTYAQYARLNQRPCLLFDQASPYDPAAIWEAIAPRDKQVGFGVFLKLLLFPVFTVDPGGWNFKLHLGIEVVKPNSSQVLTTSNYFPASMLWNDTVNSTQGSGQPLAVTYELPSADVADIQADDLLRVFVGLKRADSYSGLKLYCAGAVLYDELNGGP